MARGQHPGPRDVLHEAIDLAVGADEIGVNGAYFRVHHFATRFCLLSPLKPAALSLVPA